MKNVRNLLLLLAAVFLFSGFMSSAVAAGGNDVHRISLAAIDADTFTLTDSMVLQMLPWDTTASVLHVGANKVGFKVFQFFIRNDSHVVDTLESITFKSFNDKDYSASKISLYKEGTATALASITNPGAFSENTTLTFSGLNLQIDTAAATDSVVFYFAYNSDSTHVDTSYNDLYMGLKITGGGITLTNAGQSPAILTDTLMFDTPTLTYGSGGRLVNFDTKPPELDVVAFSLLWDQGGGCVGNGIVNLGDSIRIVVADTTGNFELYAVTARMTIFGGTSGTAFEDSILYAVQPGNPDDSAMAIRWGIPDTAFAGGDEVSAGFFWLVVTAQDIAGNSITDSIQLSQAIDTRMPIYYGDSVWVSLYYDANGDDIAAVGDTVTINAWMTSNPIGEVTAVTADLSGWGYGSAIALLDQSGDRKFIKKLELTAGALDLEASDSLSIFYVTAVDNACNHITDSNLAHFGIDNEIPAAPTITYVRQYDHDANNIINIDDSIKITVDASTTADLTTTCEVMTDLLTSGLGGSQTQCIEDTTTAGIYTLTYKVANGLIYAIDVGASVHTVEITLTDDAGNAADYTSPTMPYPVDTKPPTAVENLVATKGACAISLDWDSTSAPPDDSLYLIFWDGGNGWTSADTSMSAGRVIFKDTLGATTSTTWTTDGTVELEHGKTYQFVVRVIDDANNREYNYNRVSSVADCQPPVACISYPASGGAYGTGNNLSVIAESSYPDIAGVALYIRDADLGSGTPGAWISWGGMAQPGSGTVFTMTIDSADMDYAFGCVDDNYEIITVAIDEVGNEQSIAQAIDSCGLFAFHWFCTALPAQLIAINDTVSAQTSCGFDVARADSNKVEIDVTDYAAGDTFTVDVWVFRSTTNPLDSTRVNYYTDVTTMPYTFYLNATAFPKGTRLMKIKITRNDGNMNTLAVNLCVPDVDAPTPLIVSPVDGSWVRRSCNALNPVPVTAWIWDESYDPSNTTKVEFYSYKYGSTTWTKFDVVTVPTVVGSDSTWEASWNNCSYADGDTVMLRAMFYDDKSNVDTTPAVMVFIDATSPDITLTIPQAKTVCDIDAIPGSRIDLYATVNTVYEDILNVKFYYAIADSPDIFAFYHYAGTGDPATSDGIYKLHNFDADNLIHGKYYRFRAIATDVAGNVMWDYDGDGLFDDNTFDPATKNSDKLYLVDNYPATGYIREVVVTEDAGDTVHVFATPVDPNLREDVYAAMGDNLTAHVWLEYPIDTCRVASVVYYWNGNAIGTGATIPPYDFTFDPVEMGLVSLDDIHDDYVMGVLGIEITDKFGQTDDDQINVYILDITPNQAVISNLATNACVAGEVDLQAIALNDYNLQEVRYYLRPAGETTWAPIGSSSRRCGHFRVTWSTLNANVPDGDYELAAVAVDHSGNVDPNPIVLPIKVANGFVTAEVNTPAELSYIGEDPVFTATVTSGAPDSIQFLYKGSADGTWSWFATDMFSPWQAVLNFGSGDQDGYYNIKVRAFNCAGVYKDSEWRTVFFDYTEPRAILTEIAGQDVENMNDPTLDLTGMKVVPITASFFDDQNSIGNSGIARVGFFLIDSATGGTVLVKDINPATAGSYTVQFDISGLPQGSSGTYIFIARAWDAVGNWGSSAEVKGYISDEEMPVTSIAGYYPGAHIYGYDWSGDASYVLFEYQAAGSEEWIGIAQGIPTGLDNLWYAEWDPDPGTYTVRMKAHDDDGNGNYDPYQSTLTINADGSFAFGGTGLGTLAARKNNYTRDDIEGVVGITSALGEPVVIGIYKPVDQVFSYQDIAMEANLDNANQYYGSFCANNLNGGGKGYFFALVPAATGNIVLIQQTSLSAYQVWEAFGTNGKVKGNSNTVELTIPPGATSGMTAVIMESWMPVPGVEQDVLEAIGNNNGLANYIGCNGYESEPMPKTDNANGIALSEYGCDFSNNQYATIKMPYSSTIHTPAESLFVCWWDGDEWDEDGIYYPTFDTLNHTVTFKADELYGLFAVVRFKLNVGPSPITIELLPDYSGCGYYTSTPSIIKMRIKDLYSGIDPDWFEVFMDGVPIIFRGNAGATYDYSYDPITGYFWLYWSRWYEEEYEWYQIFGDPLTCGAHTMQVGAKNYQAQWDSATFTINVDCAPPTVVFENSYVGKNPTITFNVTDALSGVDTSSIHVDVIAVRTTDTNGHNPDQYESLFFLQTFFPGQISIDENGTVTIPTTFELEDERAIVVVLYDGTRSVPLTNGDPVAYGEWDAYYSDAHGIHDCAGNAQTPIVQILAIDANAPHIWVVGYDQPGDPISALPGTCVKLQISDDGSGFDQTTIVIKEDGTPIDRVAPADVKVGKYSFTAATGIIDYCPTPGADIEVIVTDKAGNITYRRFFTGNPTDIVNATLNRNPWDPATDGNLKISYEFTGPSTVKIYDFGGDLVKTLTSTNGEVFWNGSTEKGTRVADGVYFGHIEAEGTSGTSSTVIKIAVVEK